MGSDSDLKTLKPAIDILKEFRENLHTQVRNKNNKLSTIGPDNYLRNK